MLRHNAQPGPRAGWLISMLALVLGIGTIGVILGGTGDDRRRVAPTPSPSSTDTAGLLVASAGQRAPLDAPPLIVVTTSGRTG